MKIKLHFDYLNSGAIKYLYDWLSAFDTTIFNVEVVWLYNITDELMKENEKDYQLILPKITFRVIETI